MDAGSNPSQGHFMISSQLEDICDKLTNKKYNQLCLDVARDEHWHRMNEDWNYCATYPDYFRIWLDTWEQLKLEYADVIRPVSRRERKKRAYAERYAKACKSAC